MNFQSSRRHLSPLLAFAVALSIVTNCLAFDRYRTFAAAAPVKAKAHETETPKSDAKTDKKQISESFGKLPLSFEANMGQAGAKVEFISRGSSYGIFLSPHETRLALRNDNASSPEMLSMQLVNANASSKMVGVDELPGKTNYFLGNDPRKWRTEVSNYARVRYENVYRGIDMVYYGNQKQLEYDFVVAPGSDPSQIKMVWNSAKSLRLAPNGDLIIAMKGGEVVQRKPIIYQDVDGVRQEISGGYVLTGKRKVAFQIGEYDKTKTLVIDPILAYSTFLGGSRDDAAFDIAVDSSGAVYVTGETLSANFPTASPVQGSHAGLTDYNDAFVTKINSSGSAIVYSTYLGGSTNDNGWGIEVDSSGVAYIAGYTDSSNFPMQSPRQSTSGGGIDTVLFKLSAAGSTLLYSTYHGGSNHDLAFGLDIDTAGNMYVVGYTISTNYPTANAFQSTGGGTCGNGPCDDGFLFKMNAAGNQLVYSTYLGGSNNQDRAMDVVVDSSGTAYVVGFTSATNFPVSSPLQSTQQGAGDAFISAFTSTGSIVFSTYLGGNGSDSASGVALDSSGNIYLTGSTASTNFPTLNAFQSTRAGVVDAFVTKINSTGSALVYSTYLGGNDPQDEVEGGSAIVVDADGNAYVTGNADSSDFPTVSPVQGSVLKPDVFVTKFNAAGTALIYSTSLGGTDSDFGKGIAIDVDGNAYVCGHTFSLNYPTANALQPIHAGGNFSFSAEDAFIAKISNVDGIDITGLVADAGGNPIANVRISVTGSGTQQTFTNAAGTYTIYNLNPGGNYTLTPTKTNFTFSPTSQTFNNLTADQTADFTGAVNQVILDGKIKDGTGTGVSGVTVNLTGTQTASVLTGAGGTYSFTNLNAGGSYTVTPSRNSDIFVPASKTFNNLSSNQTFDFTLVYTISGQVTDSLGSPASGVTVTLSGAQSTQALTDVSGNYSFTNLPAGSSYTVTPSKPNFTLTYTFTPPSTTVASLTANQTANFSYTTVTNTSVFPVADAYVEDGTAAATNFGSATPMLLKTNNTAGQKRDIYLKFDLTTVRRSITSVKLRFSAALSVAGAISTSAYSVADTTWLEKDPGGINWNNKPVRSGTALTGATVSVTTTTLATYELNVTSYVAAEKAAGRDLISLALHNPSNTSNHINVNSREAAADKPQLLITTSDDSNVAPAVNITAPTNGAPFIAPANITVNANSTDSDGTVSKVDFYAGTTLIGTDNGSPYSVQWNSVTTGAYTLRAVATDSSGATTTSAPVNITVGLVNIPPTVSMTAPATGLSFAAGGNVNLAADAGDPDGSITKVEFFTGSNSIGIDTTYPYTFAWTNIPAGAHSVTAVATDNSNATTQSAAISLNAVWRTGLTPTMDAYVRDGGTAATNFGALTELQVQSSATTGSNRETHLKFDLTAVSAITGAKLRLFGGLIDTSGTNVPTAVFATTPNTWTETGVTWNTKPAVTGSSLVTATITDNVARWYEWDLSTYIKQEKDLGHNTISLVIKSTANSTPYAVFNSKEAATNQPHLEITTTAIRNVLLVTGSSTLNTSETAIKSRIETLGFTVTVKAAGSNQNSAVNTVDAMGKAAVVISSTVTPANVLAKFRNVAVPVFLWEAELLDDQAMTGTVLNTDFGVQTSQTQVAIIDSAHQMAAGLTGTVSVVTASSSLTWGKPNVNSAKIASLTGDATKITIFGYETGAVMPGSGAPGVPAAARRVGFFLTDTNGVNLTDPQGKALFDAAFKWVTANTVAPTISALEPASGTIGTPVTISGYNFGDTQSTSTVSFNGVNATPSSWTNTSIVAAVPSGATSGPVVVVVSGLASNSITITIEQPPVDTDSDGLPDAWELQHFGNLSQGANDNPDGDALNNLQEYLQGRNPTVGTVEDSGGGVGLRIYTPFVPASP